MTEDEWIIIQSYPKLQVKYNSLLKENEMLKQQVNWLENKLTEVVQANDRIIAEAGEILKPYLITGEKLIEVKE